MRITGKFAEAASSAAMHAAAEYLEKHGLEAEPEAVCSCIRAHVKARMGEALHDAREAADAGMTRIATDTFLATMALAGIEAAKEAGVPRRERA